LRACSSIRGLRRIPKMAKASSMVSALITSRD
jgi:hypothetical protein